MRTPARSLVAFALVPLLLVVTGCGSGGSSASKLAATGPPAGRYRGSIPPPGLQLPSFALHSYRGPLVRSSGLHGRVVLITFLDTHCTTKCPIVASAVGQALRRLTPGAREQVAPLAISVDPKGDTPASVRLFLRHRHALDLDFLIGSVRKFRPVWHAFGVLAAAQTGSADFHSSDVRVFNRSGTWVSTMHAGVDLSPANLDHDLVAAMSDRQR